MMWDSDYDSSEGAEGSSWNHNKENRVIMLLDADCFEVQVWMKRKGLIYHQDVPVVVKNHDDILLAVNYTAKARGVSRGEGRRSLEEAREICADLEEIRVPSRYGKVDTFYPLTESKRILDAIKDSLSNTDFGDSVILERPCNDEIYLDVTDFAVSMARKAFRDREGMPWTGVGSLTKKKSHPCYAYNKAPRVVMETKTQPIVHDALYDYIDGVWDYSYYHGYLTSEILLMYGTLLADKIIQDITRETGYICSAGVGSNKLLAKLACSENKPEGICVLTDESLPRIFKSRDFMDIPGFGSKQGYLLTQELMRRRYGLRPKTDRTDPYFTFSDIQQLDEDDLNNALSAIKAGQVRNKAELLLNACRGIDETEVTGKIHRDSMSISKSFRMQNYCDDESELDQAIHYLAKDMQERLNYSSRHLGRQMQTLSFKVSMRSEDGYCGPRRFDIYYKPCGRVDWTSLRDDFEYVAQEIDFRFVDHITVQARDVVELE